MEWLGTGFVLTIGGIRLRLRVVLEDTPREDAGHGKARAPVREERDDDRAGRRSYRLHPR